MTSPRVIAIDGPAGSGKSTLARAIARVVALPYINTGLMYRALAAAARRWSVAPSDAAGLLELTDRLRFTVGGEDPPELEIEGSDLGELTDPEIERTVSIVASHPVVRVWMRDEQRALGRDGAVMEGRDIGSVVFPDARVKLFLSAPSVERIRRRVEERPHVADDLAGALRSRDLLDARTVPLEPAPGAVLIDTSGRTVDETLDVAISEIHRLAPELMP
jgi:CMP/dCMP kinase